MNRQQTLSAIDRQGVFGFPLFFLNRDRELSDIQWTHIPGNSYEAWGLDFTSIDGTMGQVLSPPLAGAGGYRPPSAADCNYGETALFIRQNSRKATAILLGISGFNLCTLLAGAESFLTDLYLDPPKCEAVADMVFSYLYDMVPRLPEADLVRIDDDTGTQKGMLISPDMWRSMFLPRYTRLAELLHSRGIRLWLHSCGCITPIIDDIISAGVDVLEFLQPDIYGIEKLCKWKDRITFCCSVDHQHTALQGSAEEITAYVEKLSRLATPGGGFVGYIEYYPSLNMTEAAYNSIKEAFFTYSGRQKQ